MTIYRIPLILLLAAFLPATGCGDQGTDPPATSSCTFKDFLYRDGTFDLRLGPELLGDYGLSVRRLSATRLEFEGTSRAGLRVSLRALHDAESDKPPRYSTLIFPARHTGTLRAMQDTLYFEYDAQRLVPEWVAYAAWVLRGRTIAARWASTAAVDSGGWDLAASFRCDGRL